MDARDVALAFANGVDRAATISGKVLLIGGNESYVLTQRELEDAMMEAVGLGRLGPSASLPGNPADDRGWSFTGWYDTTEAQQLLDFQEHDWSQTVAWLGPNRRAAAGSPCDCWGRCCGAPPAHHLDRAAPAGGTWPLRRPVDVDRKEVRHSGIGDRRLTGSVSGRSTPAVRRRGVRPPAA